MDENRQKEWLKEIALQSKSESYAAEEMISCKKCERKNPPTRLNCLYCGVELEFDESQKQFLKPVLRKVEAHQKGYNLIYLANLKSWDDSQISEVAKMTRIDAVHLGKIFWFQKALPIARAETEKEVEIVSQRLKENGIETTILPDEEFKLETVPQRLRGLKFKDDEIGLILFNGGETVAVKKEDISLIVVGGVFERKLESTEKYKRNKDNKILETSEISSDEILIDIYTVENQIGYRISPKGFDFSCLGDAKKMLALENVKILIEKLKEFAPNAKFDDEYINIRECLTDIWNIEQVRDSKGMKRQKIGSFNQHNIVSTNNLLQFTRYSRLQWFLL